MGDATDKKSTDDLKINEADKAKEIKAVQAEAEEIKLAQAEAEEAELNAALEAGFKGKDFDVSGDTKKEVVPDKKEVVLDKKVEPKAEDKTDEWEGVPDSIKARFDKMDADLKRVTNIANTASGRASKLQGQLEKQEAPKPKPTSETIRAAMTDKTKRDELRGDFSEFAEAMDESDDRVANAVGAAMDKFKAEMTEASSRSQNDFDVKRNLDIRHPGWEATVSKEEFKSWVYEGGPDATERTDYENLLDYAQNLHGNSPTESAAIFDKANKYYNDLLARYPVWANEKGSLFNDPSGASAVKLLDVYTENANIINNDRIKKVEEDEAKAKAKNILEKNQQRLADNVTPTSSNINDVPPATEQDVEKAFADGFNN